MLKLLEGVKVLECALLPTGDQVGRSLGDLGADVLKIERPGQGDYLRLLGKMIGPAESAQSAMHLFCNRNKRSVTLDLQSDGGRALFFELLKETDIFVDGLSGDACEQLGIGYPQQRAVKSDIIYCQANGFGVHGPYGQIPTHGYQMAAAAACSRLDVGEDGIVRDTPGGGDWQYMPGMVDGPLMGGTFAALTAVAALRQRERTGEGVYIDCSAVDAIVTAQSTDTVLEWNDGRIVGADQEPPPYRTSPRRRPKYTYYETKDHKFVMLAVIEHKFWDKFCRAVGREDLVAVKDTTLPCDFQGSPKELIDELVVILRSRTQAEWMEMAVLHDLPITPANQRHDLLHDPHLRARNFIEELDHPHVGSFVSPGWPAIVEGQGYETYRPAPLLGEHTDVVIAALGRTPDEIRTLRERGVI